MVIEVLTFRLGHDRDDTAFLDADSRVQAEFVYRQPGVVRRTTARSGDGEWLVVTLWETTDDAIAADGRAAADPAASEFMAFVDEATVRTARYTTRD